MNQSITITVTEAAQILRSYGMHCSAKTIADGIENGSYPFGRIVSVGESGRRRVEIFRVHFCRWLHEMTAENTIESLKGELS